MSWLMLLVDPVQEVLNLRNFYQCNIICHECKADKDTYMVPKLQAPRYNSDEFWRQCIKPGPICFLDIFWSVDFVCFCSPILSFHPQPIKKRSTSSTRRFEPWTKGPLLQIPHFKRSMVKWCAMHLLHLGCDLWILGSSLRVLLSTTDFWGDGSENERLHKAWLDFKQWCREHKWQTLNLDT